jgi:hypothetical protein
MNNEASVTEAFFNGLLTLPHFHELVYLCYFFCLPKKIPIAIGTKTMYGPFREQLCSAVVLLWLKLYILLFLVQVLSPQFYQKELREKTDR